MVTTDTAELNNTVDKFKESNGLAAFSFFLTLIGVGFFAYNLFTIQSLHIPGEPPTEAFQNYNMLLYVFLGCGFLIVATVISWFSYFNTKLHAFIPGFIITMVGTGTAIFGSIMLVYLFNVNFVNYPFF